MKKENSYTDEKGVVIGIIINPTKTENMFKFLNW